MATWRKPIIRTRRSFEHADSTVENAGGASLVSIVSRFCCCILFLFSSRFSHFAAVYRFYFPAVYCSYFATVFGVILLLYILLIFPLYIILIFLLHIVLTLLLYIVLILLLYVLILQQFLFLLFLFNFSIWCKLFVFLLNEHKVFSFWNQ